MSISKKGATALPPDFFEVSVSAASTVGSTVPPKYDPSAPKSRRSSKRKATKDDDDMPTSIPEGFFDDKALDAKVRKVETKDPLDEEWQKFQKEVQQLQTATDTIVEEDDERLHLERTLDEIDEEIRGWAKINELEKKIEKTVPVIRAQNKIPQLASSSSVEDDEEIQEDLTLDEMMDWRSKQLWKEEHIN